MAGDINKIINGLTSIKPKFEKLAKNNDLISVIDDLNDISSASVNTNVLNKHEPKILPNEASKLPLAHNAIVLTTSGSEVAIAKNKAPAVLDSKSKYFAISFVV